MKTLKARVLSILSVQLPEGETNRTAKAKRRALNFGGCVVHISDRRRSMNLTFVSLLKSFASKKYTVGLNGFVDFEMFSEPHV